MCAGASTHTHIRMGSLYPSSPPPPQRVPLVSSIFLKLPGGKAKHSYSWYHSPRVNATYRLYGTLSTASLIRNSRKGLGAVTETVPWDYDQMSAALASELNVSVAQLRLAARQSSVKLHCPSEEVIVVWLAKMVAVKLSMAAHPELNDFGWVDVGFNVYRLKRVDPPPPPWNYFWPAPGSVALSRMDGACHDELRGTNYTKCPVATFLYGDRAAWRRWHTMYFARVRNLVLQATASLGHAAGRTQRPMLCTEQDIYEDVARMAPPPSLKPPRGIPGAAVVDEFETSHSQVANPFEPATLIPTTCPPCPAAAAAPSRGT